MEKVKLIRRAMIWHEAGETIEVSPAAARHLFSVGSAVPVRETPEGNAAPAAPEIPEAAMEAPEIPETAMAAPEKPEAPKKRRTATKRK